MVFASLEFITLFLPLFLLLYAVAGRARRNTVLLFSSWVFYGWWSPLFLSLFIALTVLGWAGGIRIHQAGSARSRQRWLALFISLNIGLLCWFKYANIALDTFNQVLISGGRLPLDQLAVILPIGLSFIVLQSISYLIDVYRKTVAVDYSFIGFGAYQSMFVHLIAGPIIRYDWVRRELAERPFNWLQLSSGARRFMIGMCMKVLIADTLSPIADHVFLSPDPSFSDAWIGVSCYTLQLFFDFAGYSAMAIGLGMMLGFSFPENFNNPYLASSIQDFWRRWHISLSSWIRDYLYVPLGGNRHGAFRVYLNLLVTMALAGLWHGGDSWNFLLWGLAHGLALCIDRAWSRNENLPKIPVLLSRVLTLGFVMLAWTMFRAHTFGGALTVYGGQFGLNGFALSAELQELLRPAHFIAAAVAVGSVVMPAVLAQTAKINYKKFELVGAIWPIFGFMLAFALLASRGATPFLYFQF